MQDESEEKMRKYIEVSVKLMHYIYVVPNQ